MKIIILTFLICLSFIYANAQLKADAGNDIVLCFSDSASSTAQLGGFPVASGGVEPYTYTWSGKIVQYFGPEKRGHCHRDKQPGCDSSPFRPKCPQPV